AVEPTIAEAAQCPKILAQGIRDQLVSFDWPSVESMDLQLHPRRPPNLYLACERMARGRRAGPAAKTSASGRSANVAKVRHESFCDASCSVAARYEGWHGAGGAALDDGRQVGW